MIGEPTVIIHEFTGSASAQIFSMIMHTIVMCIGMILVRGYYSVFRSHPSNVAFAMVLLLSSMVTTSAILWWNAALWFFQICLFCELTSHYAWLQIFWTGTYGAGFILLYLILKHKISL
jgi:hypothetical protein